MEKIHNQLNELYNNEFLKKDISLIQKNHKICKTYNKQVYGKVIEKYEKVVVLTTGILNKISSNSIENSYAIHWLLKNGYFSYNDFFKLTDDKKMLKNIKGYLGIDVMTGYGNEQAVSSLCNDINNMRGFFSNYLVCSKENNELGQTNDSPQYIINLLYFEGCYYGYDVFKNEFYEFKKPYILCPIDKRRRNENIYYLPVQDIVLNNHDLFSIVEKFRDFENCSGQTSKSKSDINYAEEIVQERLYKNKNELESYKTLTKKYSKEINLSI